MKLAYTVLLLFFILVGAKLAEAQPTENWDQEKLIGRRYFPNGNYLGSPYFISEWVSATVHFFSGGAITDLLIKYDGEKDELISKEDNELSSTIIQIKKSTIKSFEFEYKGFGYLFEQRYFDGFNKGDRLFQVFYKGTVDLLCFYKIDIEKDQAGGAGSLIYNPQPQYYLYKTDGGYHSSRLTKKQLLRYVEKDKKREAKRLFRQDRIRFKSPNSFAQALLVLDENKIKIEF